MATPERIQIGANVIRVLVSSDDSDGKLTVIEYDVPAGFPGPPLHLHPSFDEFFYVIDGELELRLDGDTIRSQAGGSLFVAGGRAHTFANPFEEDARMLVVATPGGIEGFFREMAAAAGGGMPPPEVAAALNAKYGMAPAG